MLRARGGDPAGWTRLTTIESETRETWSRFLQEHDIVAEASAWRRATSLRRGGRCATSTRRAAPPSAPRSGRSTSGRTGGRSRSRHILPDSAPRGAADSTAVRRIAAGGSRARPARCVHAEGNGVPGAGSPGSAGRQGDVYRYGSQAAGRSGRTGMGSRRRATRRSACAGEWSCRRRFSGPIGRGQTNRMVIGGGRRPPAGRVPDHGRARREAPALPRGTRSGARPENQPLAPRWALRARDPEQPQLAALPALLLRHGGALEHLRRHHRARLPRGRSSSR